ncbi:MAG: tetratricopeptide repeat protein [Myxococcales bacterium]|nr:tetratricopeptide repeat protein [Myxococcales bacterium]
MRSLYLLPRVRAAFERALLIDPGHVNTIVAQGELDMILPRIAGGSKKRAEALYRRALELDPHHTRAMALLAELLAQQGRRPEASEMARQVLAEETPTYPGERRKFDGPRAERLLERL